MDKKWNEAHSCHRRLIKELLHLIPGMLDNGEYFVKEISKSNTDDGIKLTVIAHRR
jgi:hypothetical protein